MFSFTVDSPMSSESLALARCLYELHVLCHLQLIYTIQRAWQNCFSLSFAIQLIITETLIVYYNCSCNHHVSVSNFYNCRCVLYSIFFVKVSKNYWLNLSFSKNYFEINLLVAVS